MLFLKLGTDECSARDIFQEGHLTNHNFVESWTQWELFVWKLGVEYLLSPDTTIVEIYPNRNHQRHPYAYAWLKSLSLLGLLQFLVLWKSHVPRTSSRQQL